MLSDMVIFHIVISPACEIAEYRAWVGAREKLSVLVIVYDKPIKRERERGRKPGSTNNLSNILSNILKN